MSDGRLLSQFLKQARAAAVAQPSIADAGQPDPSQSRPLINQWVIEPKAESVDLVRDEFVGPRSTEDEVELSIEEVAAALRAVYSRVSDQRYEISSVFLNALTEPDPGSPFMQTIRFFFQGLFPYSSSHLMLKSREVWWAHKGHDYLVALLDEAKSTLEEAGGASEDARMDHLRTAADILGIAAIVGDVVSLLVRYLEVLKVIVDEAPSGPAVRVGVQKTIIVFFDEIEPFMKALLEDKRESIWGVFEAIKANLAVAEQDYFGWRKRLGSGLELVAKASALIDAAMATLAVYDVSRMLIRGGPMLRPPPPRPRLALAGAGTAGLALPSVAVLEGGPLLVVFSVGRFGKGRRVGRRPPATEDPDLPWWLRDWLRRFLARHPKMSNFLLKAVRRELSVPGLFTEEIVTGTPGYSFEVTNARGGKIQIDGFDLRGQPVEVRWRETGRTLRGGESPLEGDPDVVSLMRGEPTRSALRRQEQIENMIRADLRIELEIRNTFLEEAGLKQWNYVTNSRWYHGLLVVVIMEKRLTGRFDLTLLQ